MIRLFITYMKKPNRQVQLDPNCNSSRSISHVITWVSGGESFRPYSDCSPVSPQLGNQDLQLVREVSILCPVEHR